MQRWATEFQAEDAKTGEMKTWCGEVVLAPTHALAQEWCYNNRGYLKVIGTLVGEIPFKEGEVVDYDTIQNN